MDVRKEVLEFGLLPAAVLLPKFETLTAVTDFHSKLLKETEIIDGQPGSHTFAQTREQGVFGGFVSVASVRRLLKMSPEVWNVMMNVMDSISCRSERRGWMLCTQDGNRIELHALSLFLLIQIYGKQAAKRADYELRTSSHAWPQSV